MKSQLEPKQKSETNFFAYFHIKDHLEVKKKGGNKFKQINKLKALLSAVGRHWLLFYAFHMPEGNQRENLFLIKYRN